MIANSTFDSNKVSITWDSNETSRFHHIWLRDHCQCSQCYHPDTKQRLFSTFEIPEDVHPSSVVAEKEYLKIRWAHDGHESVYQGQWLQRNSYDPRMDVADDKIPKIPWTPESLVKGIPRVEFSNVMDSEAGVAEWTKKIHQYGFCLIDSVPETTQDTEKLCERLAYIRETHYGRFWDFTADLAKNDTAYTDLYLASHTDGTYWSDTPGLQLFHLLFHDGTGGETMLVDSLYCTEQLKQQSPESYELLSRQPIPAHSAGEESVCIRPAIPQPVIKLGTDGELVQVRWNNDDRSTMSRWEDPDDVLKFYKAIRLWNKILRSNEYIFQLKPGQCLIFDNWRVLHGRQAFKGARRMCGAYINRDDFISRFELLNYGRANILKEL